MLRSCMKGDDSAGLPAKTSAPPRKLAEPFPAPIDKAAESRTHKGIRENTPEGLTKILLSMNCSMYASSLLLADPQPYSLV
jgi:hypothetical protein